jgi:TrmH family RNA methyltransferase
MLSDSNARVLAARHLKDRRARRDTGLFLAEGAQAVTEALARAGAVQQLFATAEALDRLAWLQPSAAAADVLIDEISAKSAASLSDTVTPQGIVAVCRRIDVSLEQALANRPRLVAALVDTNDPGNAGTVLRTADAAGADAVVLVGGVDIYNAKAVRASAGSLFHVDVVVDAGIEELLAAASATGLQRIATSGHADHDLDEVIDDSTLAGPTLWLFGSEAHGLPDTVLAAADLQVRVPIYGAAESLNLAAAAAVCLFASARSQRRHSPKPA